MSGYVLPGSVPFGGNTMVSGADLSAKSGYFGYVSSETVLLGTDSTGQCHGVITDGGVESGSRVGLHTGRVKVIAGAAIATGVNVSCSSTGKAQTAASGDYVVGVACTLAAADLDVIEIFMTVQDLTAVA